MARNSTIWRISTPGAKDIYLAGTMHLRSNYAFGRKEKFLELINVADEVITETSMEDLASAEMQSKLLIPEEKHLRDFISKAQYTRYRAHLQKVLSVNLDELGYYHPMVIQNIITQILLKEDQMEALDHFIHSTAKRLNKVCSGLETLEEQQEIFDQFNFDQQIIMLKRVLRNISKFRQQQLRLAGLYLEEKIHKLYQIAKNSTGSYKQLLIYARNERMTERILKLNPELTYFIGVGAAHLPGEKGILHLLNENGKIINPL